MSKLNWEKQQQDMAVDISLLEYSSHGKTYKVVRKRVFSISELGRGDHITFHRRLYWHHAIVEYIDRKNGKIGVIHYNKTPERFTQDICNSPKKGGKASVLKETFEFKKEPVYLMIHIHGRCFDPETVVLIAQKSEGDGGYNLVYNNCEHFAMRCKTGVSSSYQVDKVMDHLVSPFALPIIVSTNLFDSIFVPLTGRKIGFFHFCDLSNCEVNLGL